ncbi:uncharacterized protein LOC122502086 [Leptopilina heterotoma]|uniref:uncharacterized protein LOC122502086 n=1 Tax=Leptopilina heterotoma TaxID=63436 RepID=UPI001CA98F55|nr:uncharacterized protein LOC122502086 [Leptopilina heterotoma]
MFLFGMKHQWLLGGDFRQLLPVKENGTRAECLNLSIKFSSLWKHFEKFTLSQNMRTLPQEIEFSAFLLNVGNGLLNDSEDCIQIPNQCIAPTETDIVIDTFGDLLQRNEYKLATKCAILSARNIDVQELNIKVVELLDATTEKIYTSVDSTENCNDNGAITEALLPEYLNTLSPTSLPPHELCLRKYSIIMLIRNLSINEGLCNGTRLLILDLGKHLLKCEILTGDKSGEVVFLNRITLYCENEYPFSFKRRQFPIKLAFAMTINKAQGQTFEKIAVDLRKDVFTHGQGYVAYSRVKSWETLKIFIGDRPNKK